MGYRSDVVIRVHGEKDVLEAFIVQMKLQWNNEDPFEDSAIRWYEGSFLAEFQGHKWYENYSFVISWTKALRSLNGREEIWAEFIRIGEDYTDNEYESFGGEESANDRTLWLSRSIQID